MNSWFLSINTFIRYLSSALMILYAVCKLLLRGFFRLHFFLATSSQTTNAVLMNCSVDFRSRRSQQVIYQKSFFSKLGYYFRFPFNTWGKNHFKMWHTNGPKDWWPNFFRGFFLLWNPIAKVDQRLRKKTKVVLYLSKKIDVEKRKLSLPFLFFARTTSL